MYPLLWHAKLQKSVVISDVSNLSSHVLGSQAFKAVLIVYTEKCLLSLCH